MRCEEQQLFERASGGFSCASSLFRMKRKTFKKERESFSLHSSGQSSPTHEGRFSQHHNRTNTIGPFRLTLSPSQKLPLFRMRRLCCLCPASQCVGDEDNFPSGYSTDWGVAGEQSSLGFCIKLLVDVVRFSSCCPCCCVNTVFRMRMF